MFILLFNQLYKYRYDEEQQDEFQIYTDDDLNAMSKNTLQGEIDVLKGIRIYIFIYFMNYEFNIIYVHFKTGKIQNASPNLSVLEEYRRREEEYMSRAKDLEEITSKRDECKKEFDRLRKQRLEEFMQGFTLISQKLKEMYQVFYLHSFLICMFLFKFFYYYR
jgi:hypothetical protein